MDSFRSQFFFKQQFLRKVINETAADAQREASAELRFDVFFQHRIIFNVGRLLNSLLAQSQPLVAVERKAVPRGGCRYRLSTHNCCFIFCDFFLGFSVRLAVAEPILDLAGEFIPFDVPTYPYCSIINPPLCSRSRRRLHR